MPVKSEAESVEDRSGHSTASSSSQKLSFLEKIIPFITSAAGTGAIQHSWRQNLDLSEHGGFHLVPAFSELKIKSHIGSGGSGTVHRAIFRETLVAVKILKDGCGSETFPHRDFMHEVKVNTFVCHPNIVTFIAANTDASTPFCIFEYMEGGSLENYLAQKYYPSGHRGVSRKWIAPRTVARGWIIDILSALVYLHESQWKIVHRDLKPANLLLSAQHKTLKLSDFGLAKKIISSSGEKRVMTGGTGTLRFMAPEVFLQDADYNEKVDIYSLAMIMYQLTVGAMAFSGQTDMEACAKKVAHEGLRPSLKEAKWNELVPLIRSAWEQDYNKRPSARELLTSMNDIQGCHEEEVNTPVLQRLIPSCFTPRSRID